MIEIIYILLIVIANLLTANIEPLNISLFIIPCGTLFIGFTFIVRDILQKKVGHKKIYLYIFLAMLINFLMSIINKDLFYITLASMLAFIFSETIDTEIYTKFKNKCFGDRIILSGIFSSFIDSIIFVVIGLSPLTTNILSWNLIFYTIIGQYLFKLIIQIIVGIIYKIKNKNLKLWGYI